MLVDTKRDIRQPRNRPLLLKDCIDGFKKTRCLFYMQKFKQKGFKLKESFNQFEGDTLFVKEKCGNMQKRKCEFKEHRRWWQHVPKGQQHVENNQTRYRTKRQA